MKVFNKNPWRLIMLLAGLALIQADGGMAQTFTVLHNFNGVSDGSIPYGGVIISSNTLYGTAEEGGITGYGTVYKINTDGSGFTVLHNFMAPAPDTGTNSEGVHPRGGLILSSNTLYGTALGGGSSGYGTIFAVNTDGSGFTNLHDFSDGEGSGPYDHLLISEGTLYGTTRSGGSSGHGTVFAVNVDGSGFTVLYGFTGGSDGWGPQAGLTILGNTLYGSALQGGSSSMGTIFSVNTDGTGFSILHSFTAVSADNFGTNGDGASPYGGLIASGNTLFGTASDGGDSGVGTVFAINLTDMSFSNLHSFEASLIGNKAVITDGGTPVADLLLCGNTLYGTGLGKSLTPSVAGTVFAINSDGTGYTTLHTFEGTATFPSPPTNRSGAFPNAGLILSGNTLYGTAVQGGSSGNGTIFSLFVPPQLGLVASGTNVILTWQTNYTGYTLQSTTNLNPASWSAVSPAPVVVNGLYTVTNAVSGTQMFYRLSQ